MVDFQTSSAVVGEKVDTRWRASKHGEGSARSGQLNPALFTSGTHYNLAGATDNVVPSGVALGRVTTGGLLGPYDSTASDGRQVLYGYLNDDLGCPLGAVPASSKPTVSVLRHGIVKASFLPITAQRTTVLTATASGSFVYTED